MDGSAAGARSTRFVLVHAGVERPLTTGQSYVIGRSVECQIVLADHMVSRRHARLIVREALLIEDLGSANGVFVDGRRIHTIRRVHAGQHIQIGAQELVVGDAESSVRSRVVTRAEGRSRNQASATRRAR